MADTLQKNMDAFLKVLDVNDSTTGGGSASCIAGSMAAGMLGMVARLSKNKGLLPDGHYDKICERAAQLQQLLFDGGAKDSQAFEKVSQAFKLPKKSDEDKKIRSQAIQEGFVQAAKIPLQNAEYCSEVLSLSVRLYEKYNENCKSDLSCALMLSKAGIKGCFANVEINLPSIKDTTIVEQIKTQLKNIKDEF